MSLLLASARRAGLACLLAAGLVLAAPSAQALPVELSLVVVPPTPASLAPGSAIFVEVVVGGLTANAAPSVTALDLEIGFDDAVLDFVALDFATFVGVEITNGAGDPCTLANLDANCDVLLESSASAGLVELAVASLVAPADVNAVQPASGTIALIEFFAHGSGDTTLVFTQATVSGTTTGTAQSPLAVSVTSTALSVPEPSAAWLWAVAVVALARRVGRD